MIINGIIVDDELPAREIIDGFAKKISFLKIVGSFKNPFEAAGFLHQQPVDVVFLDIQMPELTGIDFFKSLPHKSQVVFTTAYSEYALEGFELNATDYLLKPFTFDRFLKAVNKVAERIGSKPNQSPSPRDYLTINADHKVYKVKLGDILYIEGLKEYVSYYTSDNQRIIALQSLKSLEATLPSDRFIRVHRSYIVPIERIKSLEGNQLRMGEKLIPIGRSYRERLHKKVFGA